MRYARAMAKYIVGVIIIVLLAVGGYYAYMQWGGAAQAGDQPGNTEGAVQAQEVTVGEGAEATPGSIVSVLYVGRLPDGTVFDSSEAHGNDPLRFQLGTPGIIAGFQIGVNGMKEGGERLLAIPPSFAYGGEDVKDADGNVIIPANSTLVFEVRLVKVEPAPEAPTGTPAPTQ